MGVILGLGFNTESGTNIKKFYPKLWQVNLSFLQGSPLNCWGFVKRKFYPMGICSVFGMRQ